MNKTTNIITWAYAIATVSSFILWINRRVLSNKLHPTWIERAFLAANIPTTASLLATAGLAIITAGLLYHKRLALWIVIALQALGFLGALADVFLMLYLDLYPSATDLYPSATDPIDIIEDIISVVVAAFLIPALISRRKSFSAKIRPRAWTMTVVILLSGLIVTIAVTSLLFLFWPDYHGPAWRQTLTVLLRALGMAVPSGWSAKISNLVAQTASIIMTVALIAAIITFLRSPQSEGRWNPNLALDARKLLAEFGDEDSLGYFNTRNDKLLHFSPDGRAAIAYRVILGVCLASSDPLGDSHSWPAAIASWQAKAHKYGWITAVLSCSEAGARVFRNQLGYTILRLGDEAILSPNHFHLDSKAMTGVRQAVGRARRAGLTAQINRAEELDTSELAGLAMAADLWRDGDERGFSMALGRLLTDPADEKTVVVRVYDSADELIALQSFVPWGRQGLSLDLMRRSPKAPNYTNEFLTAELMAWCTDHGIEKISLNFAFFRHVFAEAEEVAATNYRKLNSRVLGFFDRFWQVQSLYRANAKYCPEWSPRYVALTSPLSVGQVALACMIAEGFVRSPFSHGSFPKQLDFNDDQLQTLREISAPASPPTNSGLGISDQERQRRRHLSLLEESGLQGYPIGGRNSVWLSQLSSLPDPKKSASTGTADDCPYQAANDELAGRPIVGRLRRVRKHGGVCFADFSDHDAYFQLLLDSAKIGRNQVKQFQQLVDSGDLIEVSGTFGSSRNGTPSVLVSNWTMLAKAIRPVPWQGLRDPRAKARDRCLDLLLNPSSIDLLKARSRGISAVRQILLDHGYSELETPILGTTNGGATARPFRTHINAYDTDLVLRIAPELALKRLVVAGMGPIFEIGRNFRNEGADSTHNPEFTVVEAYRPLADYNDMRHLTEQIIQQAATAIHGRPVLPLPTESGGIELTDISGEWPVVDVTQAVSKALGHEVSINSAPDELIEIAHDLGVPLKDGMGPGAVLEELYGELVEAKTVFPTFYCDFPAESSPLTAPHRTKPGLVERWDLVAAGMELGTAYSELADPIIQRQRLTQQSWLAAQGDPEAMEIDNDFLSALELGMPPTGGLGIGLDRLIMAITGTNIRQVLAFPFVRPVESPTGTRRV